MIAGTSGLGSVIVFSMSSTASTFIFGFYLTMAGSFLAVTGGFTLAWSQLRYWRFKLGTPVSAANWDDLPRPYRRRRRRHPNSVVTWDPAHGYPYSGYKIGTYEGTAQWVQHHS
ncbi:uncharacterized protein LOC121378492 [Gigantopelta aegis]|uniref:uncharacterized protein LOC121378492 n=1 Tax=Gigantopelta aegis TaxID=1735272 RepID=UPI001B88C722|nr:uncharacterized protein LOC121378492 [Gigantopelta aegis]